MAFWCSSHLSKTFMNTLNENKENNLNKTLAKIISSIENLEWNRAKSLWLLIICRLKPNENLKFCTFNTEYESMVSFFNENQRYKYFCLKCSKEVCISSTHFLLYKTDKEVFINTGFNDVCEACFSNPIVRFLKKPYCLFIETFAEENVEIVTIKDVPLTVTFSDCVVFNFLCGTIWNNDHFTSIFRINGSYYLIDDTYNVAEKKIPEKSEIKTL